MLYADEENNMVKQFQNESIKDHCVSTYLSDDQKNTGMDCNA
jgi:hypothetical protein